MTITKPGALRSTPSNKPAEFNPWPRSWNSGARNWCNKGGNVFLIMFRTGHALLLPGGRFLSPRHGCEVGAKQSRKVTGLWPQTRHSQDNKLVQDRAQPRVSHVREQSETACNPRHRSYPRTIRVLAQASASIGREEAMAAVGNRPQTIRSFKQSSPANWPRTQFVRDRGPAKTDPRRRIAVSSWAFANFPVFFQTISPYEHI